MRSRSSAFVLLFVSAACKGKAPAAESAPATSASAVASSRDAAAPATALDDLLHFTDARIGVSSKVDNPRDFAEHVADGRLDTAWNGKTGDLVGGWIGFRVPKEARVRIVELTVGYVAKSKTGEDLFAMNHRIARIRVTRDGVSLGEHALDPDARDFQRIALDAPGGDFKLEVLAVKPGTRASWKELVVSELRVLGVAGPAKRATPGIPRVSVGGFDAPPPAEAKVRKPAAPTSAVSVSATTTPEEECKTWLAPLKDEHADLADGGTSSSGNYRPWLPPPPSCDASVVKTEGGVKLLVFSRSDLDESWSEPAIQRGRRTFVVGRKFGGDSHFDPHCGGFGGGKMQSARIDGGAAVFLLYHYSVSNPFPQVLEDGGLGEGVPGSTRIWLEEIRCPLGDADAAPSCASRTLAERDGPYDPSVEEPPPLPWK